MGQDVEDARLVGGRYRLEGVLGRGGMGTVWRGQDEILGRVVAVKELRFPSSVDEDEKQRLITRTLREAKAIARIRSGSAITVFDVVNEDARPWIVMELVEGRSLADQIRDDGPLTPRRAAEVGLSVLDVLRAAHREGILHRDVKPSNVLLEEGTGRVVLTDFGIAKVEGDPSVTSTGMLVGAPSYISPERARGKPPGPPADLWSLGALLYAAVEGRPPYDKGSALSTLTAVMTEPLPPLKQAGPLEGVVCGLLEKDPDKRLDVAGARRMLRAVVSAPEPEPEPEQGPGDPQDETAVIDAVPPPSPGAGRKRGGWLRGGGRPDPRTAAGAGAAAAVAVGSGAAAEPAEAAKPAEPGKAQDADVPAPRGEAGESARADLKKETPAAEVPPKPAEEKPAQSAQSVQSVPEKPAPVAAPAPEPEQPAVQQTSVMAAAAPSSGPSGPGGLDALRARLRDVPQRVVVLVVVLAVLAVGGIVLATSMSGGDDGKKTEGASEGQNGTQGGEEKKQGQGTDDGEEQGTGGTEGEQPSPDPSPEPSQSEETEEEEGGDSVIPDSFQGLVDDDFDFGISVPDAFERLGIKGRNSGAEYGSPDGGYPRIQVDHTTSPGSDALQAWKDQEASVRSQSTGYELISMETVSWRDYVTVADWQFHRTENGTKVRVLNRGFVVDGDDGYAILITCEADKWDGKECVALREAAFESFEPR